MRLNLTLASLLAAGCFWVSCHDALDLKRGLGAICDASSPCNDAYVCASDSICRPSCSKAADCAGAFPVCKLPEGVCVNGPSSSMSSASSSAGGAGGGGPSSASAGGTGGGGGFVPNPPCWLPVTKAGAPAARSYQAKTPPNGIWTGSQVVVWGGVSSGGKFLADGGMYDPGKDSWQTISSQAAPTGRAEHSMVWTGSKVIVWGGASDDAYDIASDGGMLDPKLNSWTGVAQGGPSAGEAAAVWTGEIMIFWGGMAAKNTLSSQAGGRLSGNSWLPTSTGANVPSPRGDASFAWADNTNRMLIWGGLNRGSNSPLADGAIYDPVKDSWSTMQSNGAPTARFNATTAWTGNKLIVWGGGIVNKVFDTGAVYDPAKDQWSPITTVGAPSAREGNAAVWTGSRMLIWGGIDINNKALNDGYEYDPANDKWAPITGVGAPTGRYLAASAWTGTGMFIWSGRDGKPAYADDGAIYYPVCPKTGTQTLAALHTESIGCQAYANGGWTMHRSASAAGNTSPGNRNVSSYGAKDGNGKQIFSIQRLALAFPPVAGLPNGAKIMSARVEITRSASYKDPIQVDFAKMKLHAVSFNPTNAAEPLHLSVADYALKNWGSTSFGSILNEQLIVGLAASLDLSAPAVNALSTSATNFLGIRTSYDLDDIVPPDALPNVAPNVAIVPHPDDPGTESAKLIVTWSMP